MKKYIISLIFLLYSANIFAVNFETGFYASAGLQYTFFKRYRTEKSHVPISFPKTDGFISGELGIYGNIGANFDIPNTTLKNISALIDFGYCKASFSTLITTDNLLGDTKRTFSYIDFFDTLNLGFLGKFNFNNNFSLGIGAGVMFPFSGLMINTDTDKKTRYSYRMIKDNYSNPIMPYIKLSFELRKHLRDNLLFIYGLNLFYNFGMKTKVDVNGYLEKKSNIDISIFAGISFGRQNTK